MTREYTDAEIFALIEKTDKTQEEKDAISAAWQAYLRRHFKRNRPRETAPARERRERRKRLALYEAEARDLRYQQEREEQERKRATARQCHP